MSIEEEADYHCQRGSRLMSEERFEEARAHLEAALYGVDMGMDEQAACLVALSYFDRALASQPNNADALASKGLALQYLNRPEEALALAEYGLSVLDQGVPSAMCSPDFYTNILEALVDRKVNALIELQRVAEARQALAWGLSLRPQSIYLNRLTKKLLPGL